MTASGTAIVIMCVVIVASLAIWLGGVALAARKPYHEHPHIRQRRGRRVLGGTHLGQGRSVAPHRDEPVTPEREQESLQPPERRR